MRSACRTTSSTPQVQLPTFSDGWGIALGGDPFDSTATNPRDLTQLHTDVVFLLVGLTVATVLVLRSSAAPTGVVRAAGTLLAVEVAQGVVGFVQYFTDLPVVLVAIHLLGAALVSAAMTWLLVSVRQRP